MKRKIIKTLLFLIIVILFCINCTRKNKEENITGTQYPGNNSTVVNNITEETTENQDLDNKIVTIVNDDVLLSYNYANGNGTILNIEHIDNIRWIYRKHEQESYNYFTKIILDQPNGNELASLGKRIKIYELAIEENLLNKNVNENTKCWVRLEDNEGNTGWVLGGNFDPYANGLCSVIEIINAGAKIWTVLKLKEKELYARNKLNVYDNPGLIGTNVIYQFTYEFKENNKDDREYHSDEYYDAMSVTVLAETREYDFIDDEALTSSGSTSSWLKIRTKEGLEGWVFGGYIDQGQIGGPMYYTPGVYIALMFSEI